MKHSGLAFLLILSAASSFAAEGTILDGLLNKKFKLVSIETNGEKCHDTIEVKKSIDHDGNEYIAFGNSVIYTKNFTVKDYDSSFDVHTKVKHKLEKNENSVTSHRKAVYRDGIGSMIYGMFSADYPVRSKYFDEAGTTTVIKTEKGFLVEKINKEKIIGDIDIQKKCGYEEIQ